MMSLFLLPWMSVLLFCLVVSWHSLYVTGFDLVLVPILKLWVSLKPLLFKTLPAVVLWVWVNTGAKLIGWLSEVAVLLLSLLGGWKAWSLKKIARHVGRFGLSLSTRFVMVSVVLNLLRGHERMGVKSLPGFAMHKMHSTGIGSVLRWWSGSSDRQKRIVLGVALCTILILAGHSMLGVSVLLFDLVWELLLLIWFAFVKLWRVLGPFILKLVPNFISNFIARTVLPFAADFVPVIKDDHRVMYLRFNGRTYIRRFKAWLYLKSRARRSDVRSQLSPLVGDSLRARKTSLLSASVKLAKTRRKKAKDRGSANSDEEKPS